MTAPRQDQGYAGCGKEEDRNRPVSFHCALQITQVKAVAGNAIDVQDTKHRQAGGSGKVGAREGNLVEVPKEQLNENGAMPAKDMTPKTPGLDPKPKQ